MKKLFTVALLALATAVHALPMARTSAEFRTMPHYGMRARPAMPAPVFVPETPRPVAPPAPPVARPAAPPTPPPGPTEPYDPIPANPHPPTPGAPDGPVDLIPAWHCTQWSTPSC